MKDRISQLMDGELAKGAGVAVQAVCSLAR